MSIIERLLESRFRVNEFGNKIYHTLIQGDRYMFDFDLCKASDGWDQFDTEQDASYYGVWVNIEKRMTICFAEGDLYVTVCETRESLKNELDELSSFHGAPPVAFVVIHEDGSVEKIIDKRPEL